MPLVLKIAAGAFKFTMDVTIAAVENQFAVRYLKKIVILFKSPEEHTHHLHRAMTLS